jgi:hypothetical protein
MKTKILIPTIIVCLILVAIVSALVQQSYIFTPTTAKALSNYKTIKLGIVEKRGDNCFYNQTLDEKVTVKMFNCANLTDAKDIIAMRDAKAVQYLEFQFNPPNQDKSKSPNDYGEETQVIPTTNGGASTG